MTATIGLLVWALALLVHWRGTWRALHFFLPTRATPRPDSPPISIYKPLKGNFSQLENNLISFFELDYPRFELLFAVARADDPAADVARSLMARYPGVEARLFVSPEGQLQNPKFSTLVEPFREARHDWTLISDANVIVPRDYLHRLVGATQPGVGIVAAIPAGSEPQGVGGHLDAVYLNTYYARGVLLCDLSGRPVTPGKIQFFQRSVSLRFGGLSEVGKHLGADIRLGKEMLRLGLRAVILPEPVRQVSGPISFLGFWQRHLRWARVRKAFHLPLFLTEPLLCSLGSAALGAWAFHFLFGVDPALVAMAHLGAWYLGDLLLMRKMEPDSSFLQSSFFWMLRELLGPLLWLHELVGNRARWAGRELRITARGILR